jgi:hypothetical protein
MLSYLSTFLSSYFLLPPLATEKVVTIYLYDCFCLPVSLEHNTCIQGICIYKVRKVNSFVCGHEIFNHQSADQRRVTINFTQNAEFTVFLKKKHRPNYPLRINCTPNPNFQIMQWHFMNSMTINCTPMSAILAVYTIT